MSVIPEGRLKERKAMRVERDTGEGGTTG